MSEVYGAGRAAAVAGGARRSPYDGRSTEAKDWLGGYDSYSAPVTPVLRPAGESSDPDVHYLIANRAAHAMVASDPTSSGDNRQASTEAIKAIDARLKEMGYR